MYSSMVAGVWGNSNYDEKNYRQSFLSEVRGLYEQALEELYGEGSEIDDENPFFRAMNVPELDDESEGATREAVTKYQESVDQS